jgi:hypothetical protein
VKTGNALSSSFELGLKVIFVDEAQAIRWQRYSEQKRGFKRIEKYGNRLRARSKDNNELMILGTRDTPREAARLYDAAALRHIAKNTFVNCPLQRQQAA